MSPNTWIIIGIVVLIIGGGLAIWGWYAKYKQKKTSMMYTWLLWGGVSVAVIGIFVMIYGFYRRSQS